LFLPILETTIAYAQTTIFQSLPSQQTGVHFRNDLQEDETLNLFNYLNIYNGGGVAAGDINQDGLVDLYFIGNRTPNRLYLNKGNFAFEDISGQSGIQGETNWATAVTMVDINADGWLDIYVCQAGPFSDKERLRNLLFVNNGDLSFTEQAEEYGLADIGRSTQASFFDYDRDGDLDAFIVNHPWNFNLLVDKRIQLERAPIPEETDRLYRNDNGKFTDVTDQAGIRNWAFGLAAVTADLNDDGWTDIYVACDYSEPDYYWINQGNGTFKNGLFGSFMHISNFSMGADAGDMNNDGLLDLLVVDMMAKDNRRKKTNMSGMNPEVFWDNVEKGRHYQYMQNVLQLNNGNGTFSEIAELAGIDNTDWSWSPLFADFDNDGWQDIFVSNGMRREVRNNDYSKKWVGQMAADIQPQWREIIEAMPSEKVANFCFRNEGNLRYSDQSEAWQLNHKGFSSGTAIADLDQDGDLDLVINNLDEVASIFENRSNTHRSLRIYPKGSPKNPLGIGLKAKLTTSIGTQVQQLQSSRGFQSSSEHVLHFGLADGTQLIKLELFWPDGRYQRLTDFPSSGKIEALHSQSTNSPPPISRPTPLFTNLKKPKGIGYQHFESFYDDYAKEVLLPHQYSQNGPMMAAADVNGDGLTDVFVGGGKGQAGYIFLQQPNQSFMPLQGEVWKQYAAHEDIGAAFFDADGDGDQDLYVVSGSNEWPEGNEHYKDRLYLNDGTGKFEDGTSHLPNTRFSGGRIALCDFDQDGDIDLFVGGRVVAGQYPSPPQSALFRNQGGTFEDVTQELAPELNQLGMITDAIWTDTDGDQDQDLVLVGEWMPITVFENQQGKLQNITPTTGLAEYVGWWYSIEAADLDGDGDTDWVAGNLGLNTKYRGTNTAPFEVYGGDFDHNGTSDIILGYQQEGITWPVRGRQCSSEQMPLLTQKFPTYQDFGVASIQDIYGSSLQTGLHYSANWMATSWVENLSNGKFKLHPLPNQTQLSTVNGIVIHDLNSDGHLDLVLAGNMLNAEVETCRHDASIGCILLGNGKGNFAPLSLQESGFFAFGDVKDLLLVKDKDQKPLLIVSKNAGHVATFELQSP